MANMVLHHRVEVHHLEWVVLLPHRPIYLLHLVVGEEVTVAGVVDLMIEVDGEARHRPAVDDEMRVVVVVGSGVWGMTVVLHQERMIVVLQEEEVEEDMIEAVADDEVEEGMGLDEGAVAIGEGDRQAHPNKLTTRMKNPNFDASKRFVQ
jgi:hypothetical protein